MSRRLTKEEFIEKSKLKHGDTYDYSLVIYKNNSTKVNIICRIHDGFSQSPDKHMSGQGCPLCKGSRVSKNKTYSKQSFIDKAKEVHKDFYDYSCSVYKNRMTNIDINCPEHGIFNQRPMHHLYGVGCPKCGDYRVSIHGKNNGVGWTATRWAELSKKSKNFNGFKVYIIRCWNDSECFYKIGRTYQLTKKRFYGKQMPYNYEIIKEIVFDDGVCCFNKEIELKRFHR